MSFMEDANSEVAFLVVDTMDLASGVSDLAAICVGSLPMWIYLVATYLLGFLNPVGE